MVTIYVGPKRKQFNVHKELICESDFFKAAFMSCFTEANDGFMYLPDDNPAAFDLYVEWVYRKRIPSGHTESYLHSLYDLYIMADKFCNIALKDTVMDTIQDLARKHDLFDPIFTKELVDKVFNYTSNETGCLALFLIHLMCYAFISRMDGKGCGGKSQSNKTFRDEDFDTMWEIGRDNKAIYRLLQDKIFSDIRGPANKTVVDPRIRDETRTPSRCRYHSHREGSYCRGGDNIANESFIYDISKKGCTTFTKSVSKLSLAPGETSYPVSRVATRIDKWKTKQCSSSWTFVLSPQDRLLQLHNDFGEKILEISVNGIDRIVACELGSSPQIIIHRSSYGDPARPAICMEFKTTDRCNEFREDLRSACKTTFKLMSL